jgi:hypothetical protein
MDAIMESLEVKIGINPSELYPAGDGPITANQEKGQYLFSFSRLEPSMNSEILAVTTKSKKYLTIEIECDEFGSRLDLISRKTKLEEKRKRNIVRENPAIKLRKCIERVIHEPDCPENLKIKMSNLLKRTGIPMNEYDPNEYIFSVPLAEEEKKEIGYLIHVIFRKRQTKELDLSRLPKPSEPEKQS